MSGRPGHTTVSVDIYQTSQQGNLPSLSTNNSNTQDAIQTTDTQKATQRLCYQNKDPNNKARGARKFTPKV
ncbi:hypothetical protein BGZ76_005189, partial [Entomortierella beljakovae]